MELLFCSEDIISLVKADPWLFVQIKWLINPSCSGGTPWILGCPSVSEESPKTWTGRRRKRRQNPLGARRPVLPHLSQGIPVLVPTYSPTTPPPMRIGPPVSACVATFINSNLCRFWYVIKVFCIYCIITRFFLPCTYSVLPSGNL